MTIVEIYIQDLLSWASLCLNCLVSSFFGIDSSLREWCNSVLYRQCISNPYLDNVRSSLVVYCGVTSTVYDPIKAKDIAQKVLADVQRGSGSVSKGVLYELWAQNQVFMDFCCKVDEKYYITLLQNVMKFDGKFDSYVHTLSKSVAVELRREIENSCSSLDHPFCSIKAALPIIDKAVSLPGIQFWTTYQKEAFKANFVLMKHKDSTIFSSLIIENDENIITNNNDRILQYIKENEFVSLSDLLKYWPESNDYNENKTCGIDYVCIFMKTVKHVKSFLREVELYENPPKLGGRVRKVLNTKKNFKDYLKEKQLDEILIVLAEQKATSLRLAEELKEHQQTKFEKLKSFFDEVNSFNLKIAKADVKKISSFLDSYDSQLNSIVEVLQNDTAYIIRAAIISAGGDVTQSTILLGMRLAQAVNPLKTIFGGSSLYDIYKAANELAKALIKLKKATGLYDAYSDLKTKSENVGLGFDKNREFLLIVKQLTEDTTSTTKEFQEAKDIFLEKYSQFLPDVKKPQIRELTASWKSLIHRACEIVKQTNSVPASAYKAFIKSTQLCDKTKIKVSVMIALYEEIYDFQFDLMDAMAANMWARNALDAAKGINDDFTQIYEKNRESATTLAVIGGLSFVIYKTHILNAVNQYCNIIEYAQNSIHSECLGPKTDLSELTNINFESCDSDIHGFFHNIPVKPNGTDDKAYMDLNLLYSGEATYFKIPNSQWLLDQNWIKEHDKDSALYVKQFEVYLPSQSSSTRSVVVRASPVINELVPGGTNYIIEPQSSLVYEYKEGPNPSCHYPVIKHPYMSCKTENYNKICKLTVSVSRELYPSLYARWKIILNGYEDVTPPEPVNDDLTLKVGLKICKMSSDSNVVTSSVLMQSDQCCPEGQYKSHTKSECKNCTADSHPVLAGYYCEKND